VHTAADLLSATPSELQGEVCIQPDRLALSRLCHEVLARIRAARSGNPGEFFALRKPHFSFIVGLYSFLRARQPERRMSSRSMSCYATPTCRGKAIAFMRVLTGHLIANCASLLHTKIKNKKAISGYFGGATHGYNLLRILGVAPCPSQCPRSQTTHGNTHCLRLKPRQ
jgi:hypothetical protein